MKRGIRLLALAAAAALAFVSLPASAEGTPTYLALGDSYAFAYSPLVSPADPANFRGYTDSVAAARHFNLTNAACPGETSGSMISGTIPDNGCQFYRANFPLHVGYDGAQLDFAMQYLRSHHHTDLVTLQIGGNDVLVLEAACADNATCVINGLPAVEAQMAANLNAIYAAIRDRAHYRHALVAVPYFAFNYNDPTQVAVVASLDGVVAAAAVRHRARVANVLDAFALASAPFGGIPCLAGLQIQLPSGGCDIHPSAAGHALIANTILAVLPQEEDQD